MSIPCHSVVVPLQRTFFFVVRSVSWHISRGLPVVCRRGVRADEISLQMI